LFSFSSFLPPFSPLSHSWFSGSSSFSPPESSRRCVRRSPPRGLSSGDFQSVILLFLLLLFPSPFSFGLQFFCREAIKTFPFFSLGYDNGRRLWWSALDMSIWFFSPSCPPWFFAVVLVLHFSSPSERTIMSFFFWDCLPDCS